MFKAFSGCERNNRLCRGPASSRYWKSCRGSRRHQSTYPLGERGLHRRACLQRPEHRDRRDRRAGKLGRNIRRDAGEPQHTDVEHLPGGARCFEIFAGVMANAQVETFSGRSLFDDISMAIEVVADRGSDEIRPVRVEPLLNHQVDVPEIHVAEIDRNFLAIADFGSKLTDVVGHVLPSRCHPDGWYMELATPLSMPFSTEISSERGETRLH